MLNIPLRLYYPAKRFLPRRLQLALRRSLVAYKLRKHGALWPINPAAAAPPPGWTGWPEGKRFALVLTHDVEGQRGVDRVLRLAALEESLGFRSSFNFVAEDYPVPSSLRAELERRGFEVGLHGLTHDGSLYHSRREFLQQATRINQVLKNWKVSGFRSPCMYHNLEWLHGLEIEYDASTFDTDPFEPQPDALGTIFPMFIPNPGDGGGYVELPYTLPQDLHLFVIMQEATIDIWRKKLRWLAENGGLALVATHPDYMAFGNSPVICDEYPIERYTAFLEHVAHTYQGTFWHTLPRELARFWKMRTQSEPSPGRLPGMVTPAAQINTRQKDRHMDTPIHGIVWIDLDNTPHVPFFKPIIEELQKRGHEIFITARDCFQVCGLADLMEVPYQRIGKHYGKNKVMKVAGTVLRSFELYPLVARTQPCLALSHGSRSQIILSKLLGIESVLIMDYEHAQSLVAIHPSWTLMPEVIVAHSEKISYPNVIGYPGIKEDVYAPDFQPDPSLLSELGVSESDLLVTIRPPATEAHYHNPASEALFAAAINLLSSSENVRMLLLPRNERQAAFIRTEWPALCESGKLIIPDHVVGGLNLIWYSDLVISGGGTMNREAAALGVPVYSIFRGKIGLVDRHLSQEGRLTLLETVQDVETKIILAKRPKERTTNGQDRHVLLHLVNTLESILNQCSER